MQDNITDIANTKQFVDAIKNELHIMPFIAVDQEGGSVLRLPWDINTSIGGDHTDALLKVGANVNLAPVLDRSTPAGYIRSRALATDSATIVRRATEMLAYQRQNQIVSVGKHFPGIGRALDDPHAKIPVIYATRADLESDLAPFRELHTTLDMMMTSHVRYPTWDSVSPATFSRSIATEILRNDVQYEGVLITDDLNMTSVVGEKDKYLRALLAGHDLLLSLEPTSQIRSAFQDIATATVSGRLRIEGINERVHRILKLKREKGLLP
jgi:beta-N-acetylhexosaminidase